MLIGTGYSSKHNPAEAGRDAARQAIARTGEPSLTFLFCSQNYDANALFIAVSNTIGNSKLIGAGTSGVITREGLLEKGVGVCTISSNRLKAETHIEENIDLSPKESGEKAGKKLLASGIKEGTVFIFPDGFASNISELLRGVYGVMGPGYTYTGGGVGNNLEFSDNYQFTEQGAKSNSLAVALVEGIDFKVKLGHGYEPIEQPMIITRAEGKKVYEIDGLPAFEVYSECLGGVSKEDFPYYGMKYPFAIPSTGDNFLIRDPISANKDDSITFVTEVPQNTVVTLMKSNINSLVQTAKKAADWTEIKKQVKVNFLFDCVSRYLLMQEKFREELEAVVNTAAPQTPLIGMLTFGEIGAYSRVPLLHNKSIVVAAGC